MVDGEAQVEQKVVQLGRLMNGLRVVTAGLAPTDRVIVSGVQRARPGRTVTAKATDLTAFPTGVSRGEDMTLSLPGTDPSGTH